MTHTLELIDAIGVDVVVVGAGPTGVTLGMLLGDLGVRTLVVDKRASVSTLPRARGLNGRGTEVLRLLGVEEEVAARALPTRAVLELRPNLVSEPVGVVRTGGETLRTISPCEGIAISQDVLEGVLREHLLRRACVGLQLATTCEDIEVTPDGSVMVTLDHDGATRRVSARFVVGADGWRSDVRRLAGIGVIGRGELGAQRGVQLRADLTRFVGDPPPSIVRLLGVAGFMLPTHEDHRWVLTAGPSEESTLAYVRRALGADLPVEILDDTAWVAALTRAATFRRGPVFLAGDAAHRVTPAGGSGLASGMCDAVNLAWKVAATLQGWGGPGLLDSYAVEREPVAAAFADVNVGLWQAMEAGRAPSVQLRWTESGYRYHSPVVAAGVPPREARLEEEFVPTAEPGDRAPHAWLEEHGKHRSTIDLAWPGFGLLTDGVGDVWVQAARALSRTSRVRVQASTGAGAEARAAYGLHPGEAVLIRPDGHIAWRSGAAAPGSGEAAEARLGGALAMATGSDVAEAQNRSV